MKRRMTQALSTLKKATSVAQAIQEITELNIFLNKPENRGCSLMEVLEEWTMLDLFTSSSAELSELITDQIEKESQPVTAASNPLHTLVYADKPTANQIYDIVKIYLEKVGVHVCADEGLAYYKIVSQEKKIVKAIAGSSYKERQRNALVRASKELKLTPAQIQSYIETYMTNTLPLKKSPQTTARIEEDVWCLHRCKHEPIQGEFPLISDYLDLFSDRDSFAAYIYGIYSSQYKGRQCAWVYSTGENGKSSFFDMLGKNLLGGTNGGVASFSDSDLVSREQRFFFSKFRDKKLIVNSETNQRGLFRNYLFKKLCSGGKDMVTFEGKGKDGVDGYITGHVLIGSNYRPEISNKREERSRLMYFEQQPFPEGYVRSDSIVDDMVGELDAFLYYAKLCYEERCKDNRLILQNKETYRMIEQLTAGVYEDFNTFFHQNYETAINSSIPLAKVKMELLNYLKTMGMTTDQFKMRWEQFVNEYLPTQGVEIKHSAEGAKILKNICLQGHSSAVTSQR